MSICKLCGEATHIRYARICEPCQPLHAASESEKARLYWNRKILAIELSRTWRASKTQFEAMVPELVGDFSDDPATIRIVENVRSGKYGPGGHSPLDQYLKEALR